MTSYCCPQCFNEKNIKFEIQNKPDKHETCSFCESADTTVIDPKKLFSFIEGFDSYLEKDDNGISLYSILGEYLKIFSENVLNKQNLFNSIIPPNSKYNEFKYKVISENDSAENWKEFSLEIKQKNRFFPESKIYKEIFLPTTKSAGNFISLLESLSKKISADKILFRARIYSQPLDIENMGAPPPNMVSAGRANPIGIPYLYLAENIETCIAEVRPSNNCLINLAEFKLKNDLKILDITNPREKISFLESFEVGTKCLEYINLIEIFAKELAIPILPENSQLDYIPTQFICEFFKNNGSFDGVLFKSSFNKGNNLVIFDPKNAYGQTVKQYRLTAVNYTHKELCN